MSAENVYSGGLQGVLTEDVTTIFAQKIGRSIWRILTSLLEQRGVIGISRVSRRIGAEVQHFTRLIIAHVL